ncbi:MAG: hypothetical protein L3K26_18025, partial [Candidatus Hydrogenedentes bacterium]|nr:hypothetical protein [Candidatus Hydrogenedentota bacterium]
YPHPTHPEIVYFSFKDGTFLATFNALSDSIVFEKIPLPAGYFVRDMTIDPLDSSFMALALSSATGGVTPLVYSSTNCTSSAMSIQVAPKPAGMSQDILSIAFNPQRPAQLVIGEGKNNALWVSENRGATYNKVEVPAALRHGSLQSFYGAAGSIYTGATSGFAIVASKVGAWITHDNFATFQDLTMTYDGTYLGNKGVGTPANINSIAMCSNAVYFSAQDHGVFRSKGNDLTLWEDLTGTDNWNKFPQQEVPWGFYTWMHKPQKVFASEDESCVIFNALKYLSPDTGFRVEKKFFRTRNQGATWDDITAGFGFGDIFPSGNEIVKMLFSPSDSNEIWALFTDALYHSSNGGDSFQPLSSPLFPAFGSLQASFSDIALDGSNNILYLSVGNFEGTFGRVLSLTSSPAAMYKSTDGGQTWTIFNSGQYSVKSVAVAGNGSVIVGGSISGGQPAQLVTIPYGQSYQPSQVKLTLGDTVEEIATCQLQFSPISTDGPYVLAYANKSWVLSDERNPQGPYLSKDFGETFEFIQYDLPQKHIWSLGIRDGKILLGTTFGLMEYDIAAPPKLK